MDEKGESMELRSCINYLLTTAQHEVNQQISARLKEFDLTPAQYGILNYLWENTVATPKELAQMLQVENSTMSGILDRLQKKGLIERHTDENDRRSVQVMMTQEGNQLKAAVLDTVAKLNTEVLDRIDEEKRESFLDCLRTIGHVE